MDSERFPAVDLQYSVREVNRKLQNRHLGHGAIDCDNSVLHPPASVVKARDSR